MDNVSGRLNKEERGTFLGEFDTGASIFALYKDGTYEVADFDMMKRFEAKELISIGKFNPKDVITAVYFDGNKKWTVAKRFNIETTKNNTRYSFLTDHKSSKLMFASLAKKPKIQYDEKVKNEKMTYELELAGFVDVKGWKAIGNKVSDKRITGLKDLTRKTSKTKLSPGDTVELEIKKKKNGQQDLF